MNNKNKILYKKLNMLFNTMKEILTENVYRPLTAE